MKRELFFKFKSCSSYSTLLSPPFQLEKKEGLLVLNKDRDIKKVLRRSAFGVVRR